LLLNANKAGFDDIQQYLEQENRDEAQRIQNEIQKIDQFMERQRRAAAAHSIRTSSTTQPPTTHQQPGAQTPPPPNLVTRS